MPFSKAPLLLALVCVVAVAGCSTFSDHEMRQMQTRGVAPQVFAKLDRGRPIEPRDVIELTRRSVPDAWILRQIDDHGVTSLISRADVTSMRSAGVHAVVIDAMLRASNQFADRYSEAAYVYDDPFNNDTFWGPSYGGYWEGGPRYRRGGSPGPIHGAVGVGFSTSRYHHR